MGVLSQHLNQGWRLSDIYMDDLEMASSHYTSYSRNNFVGMNSVWFFEKEISKLEDSTALYEGTIVEYHAKVKSKCTGIFTDFDIRQLCQEMGNRGWKLTCVLLTPKVVSRGFTSAKVAILVFFQRRIMGPINAIDATL